MEVNEQNGFLEELLALRRDMTWEASINNNNPSQEMSEIFSSNDLFGFDNMTNFFDQIQNPCSPPTNVAIDNNNNALPSSPIFDQTLIQSFYSLNHHETFPCSDNNNNPFMSSSDFSPIVPQPHNTCTNSSGSTFQAQEDHQHMSLLYPLVCNTISMEEEELSLLGDEFHNLEAQISCKIEPTTTTTTTTTTAQSSNISSPENTIPSLFNIGHFIPIDRKPNNNNTINKPKKLQGQPSKNLMAERRRRKRLNDRLSMLRSIVPKISKMDRTSILGDTIDYVKELIERIDNLRREIESGSGESTAEIGLFKDVKPNEVLVRNSPKFEVERRDLETTIEICCAGKPGLLYSTVTTLEALGLEIQHCVISCFNDFAMQASCSEDLEKRALTGCEEMKQALFRNAGYGGRCL